MTSNSDLFNRIEYKFNAKQRLKTCGTVPYLIALLLFAVNALLNYQPVKVSIQKVYQHGVEFTQNIQYTDTGANLIGIISIIINGILTIAIAKFFLDIAKSEGQLSFSQFIDNLNLWAKGILASLWTFLWTFLWSLLLIVPGIVKAISYSQIYYILAEYPNVSITEALKISMKITKGYKSDIFVMYLSYIGWYLLSMITCGIGLIWLLPYQSLSLSYAYQFLMKNAIEKNRITLEELEGTKK